MALELGAVEKAATLREVALELLVKADELDGTMPCTCGHLRRNHDPAGWNAGWCAGTETTRRPSGKIIAADGDCKCEEFTAW